MFSVLFLSTLLALPSVLLKARTNNLLTPWNEAS